jgi:muramoyltetrapeptide carboxypeptidase
MLIPPAFREGQKVGLFTSSSPAISEFPRRFRRACTALGKTGVSVLVAPNASGKHGLVSASARLRADDLHCLLRDESVGLLMAVSGGYNTNEVLNHLDFGLARTSPKIIVGASDVTALLVALYTTVGLVTYYGPALLSTFGEFPSPNPYSQAVMCTLVTGVDTPWSYGRPDMYTNEFQYWDVDDIRPPKYVPQQQWLVAHSGSAEGRLVGGHLGTLLALVGTPYFPDLSGHILFWEEAYAPLGRIKRDLTQLQQLGVLDAVVGMLVGKVIAERASDEEIERMIQQVAHQHGLPTLMDVNFGHTSPVLTLPVGGRARITTEPPTLTLLEPTVTCLTSM